MIFRVTFTGTEEGQAAFEQLFACMPLTFTILNFIQGVNYVFKQLFFNLQVKFLYFSEIYISLTK